ncbi:MAG: sulfite exporter TauE/SafE family protein [Schleiferiaceae bacterium]
MILLAYLASLLIGLSLGLLGGGGSILTLPVLVYLFGVGTVEATAYSLFIVGATALASIVPKARAGHVDLRTAFWFGLPSVVAVYLTRAYVMPWIPDPIWTGDGWALSKSTGLMLLFAVLMLAAARGMIVGRKPTKAKAEAGADADMEAKQPMGSAAQIAIVLAEGATVGLLTGLVGAGGGFLIIPALVLVTGLEMKVAVGTSLTIIAAKSLVGFTGDLGHLDMDWTLLLSVTAVAVFGMILGTLLSKRVASGPLQKAFGWFVLAMGLFILSREFFF